MKFPPFEDDFGRPIGPFALSPGYGENGSSRRKDENEERKVF
jgi:hypothetical protein